TTAHLQPQPPVHGPAHQHSETNGVIETHQCKDNEKDVQKNMVEIRRDLDQVEEFDVASESGLHNVEWIGRTGRAGKTGVAVMLYDPKRCSVNKIASVIPAFKNAAEELLSTSSLCAADILAKALAKAAVTFSPNILLKMEFNFNCFSPNNGNNMRGIIFGSDIPLFEQAIVRDREYEIGDAIIAPVAEQYRQKENEFQMTFNRRMELIPLGGESSNPGPKYLPIQSIPRTGEAINELINEFYAFF
ncbi:DEAD-box ATP-dependent RNA helicase 7, partial [Bienertia sinuspersici]